MHVFVHTCVCACMRVYACICMCVLAYVLTCMRYEISNTFLKIIQGTENHENGTKLNKCTLHDPIFLFSTQHPPMQLVKNI